MDILKPGHIGGSAAGNGGVPGRGEEQGLHLVLRRGVFGVIGIIELFLHLVEHINLHIAGAGCGRGGNVVHKDAELAHPQIIHMVKLGHQALYALVHSLLIGKVNGLLHGGVSHPHKVHVALGGLLRKLAHLILGADADFCFLFGDFGGIVLIPLAQVIGVGLGAVEEDIHLIALGKVKPAESAFHAPGIAIVALHRAAVLLECVVLKGGNLQSSRLGLIQHLLQGGQAVIGGVAVLAQDDNIPIGKDLDHVHIVFVLSFGEHLPGNPFMGIRQAAGAVDADIQVGGVLVGGLAVNRGQIIFGKHFVHAAAGHLVDALFRDNCHCVRHRGGSLFIGDLLGDGINLVVALGLHRHFTGAVVDLYLINGNRVPADVVVVAGDIDPQIAANGRGRQGHALIGGDRRGIALIDRLPLTGVCGYLELVSVDVLLLPVNVHGIKGGGGAEINLQPAGLLGAGAVLIGGPAGIGHSVHCQVGGKGCAGFHIAGGGGLIQGQVPRGPGRDCRVLAESGSGFSGKGRNTRQQHTGSQNSAHSPFEKSFQVFSSFAL